MGTLTAYELTGGVATVTMDDGKVNAMSRAMQGEIHAALDRAETDASAVVLAGRPGVFSAGFDLATLQADGDEAVDMVRGGFELAARVLAFPLPVAVACTGHALAMGVFLLLAGDHRVGAAGPFKLAANEVAIGLTMPLPAITILRNRLTPSAFNRAVTLAETFTSDNAVESGMLDEVVAPDETLARARALAEHMTTLDLPAHTATKRRARAQMLAEIAEGIERDFVEVGAMTATLAGHP
jgi:enoyl-CoA hydratase